MAKATGSMTLGQLTMWMPVTLILNYVLLIVLAIPREATDPTGDNLGGGFFSWPVRYPDTRMLPQPLRV